ncbi:MAG: protease HtpX [Proteobacteria bacterium]|nr:protease HtpX [Cystobacterineae bacterium]MCL2259710.1 protease HtpX [Cystobacterineae bacterium]MCL2313671.1 protease HtpX [Pseudomonadota bacterium]
MSRIFLLIVTNIAVMLVLSMVCSLLGVQHYLAEEGINFTALLVVSAIFGFGGAFISLAMSKFIAKRSVGARVIQTPRSETEVWLVQTVAKLAQRANIGMPEVAVYEGPPNAFATGARRNASLVAVSTGLLQSMNRSEVEAVLGHEVAHVANGDMVTLTLIQGVVNTFVFFLARVVGYAVDKAIFKSERRTGPGYYLTVWACQIVFGILASVVVAWFSRRREFRADAGSADYLGQPQPMVEALRRLGGMKTEELPETMKAAGIAGGKLSALFSTHPPIEARIAALQKHPK